MAKSYIVFGSPGSGKEGVAKLLGLYGIGCIATGKIFRSLADQAQQGDPVAMAIHHAVASTMKAGGVVDDETTMQLIRRKLAETDMDGSPHIKIEDDFLFDTPRSAEQVRIFCDEIVHDRGMDVPITIYLNAPRRVCSDRLRHRAMSEQRTDNDVIDGRLDEYDGYRDKTLVALKQMTRFIEVDATFKQMQIHALILVQIALLNENPFNGFHHSLQQVLKVGAQELVESI